MFEITEFKLFKKGYMGVEAQIKAFYESPEDGRTIVESGSRSRSLPIGEMLRKEIKKLKYSYLVLTGHWIQPFNDRFDTEKMEPRVPGEGESYDGPWQVLIDLWQKTVITGAKITPEREFLIKGYLEIIDKKLDGYMAEKAARGETPHLLIDRFRFDSFESSSPEKIGSRLLSRFGHTVFIFFIITPPTETVERAWKRGQTTGRYKAVDDLLYHNIEAYTGMPQLFLRWVNKKKQKVHFEFLDNDVPFGERPKTVAFGWNGEITILDPECMRRLNSYRRINVEATRPEDVYLEALDKEGDLLETFVEKIPNVAFVDPTSSALLAQIRDKECISQTNGFLESIGLRGVVENDGLSDEKGTRKPMKLDVKRQKRFTIGVW